MGRTSDANIRLMDAALALMWEESYGAVTIDDICRRADVKKGSFYYFFSSKSELAIQALERNWLEQQKPVMDRLFSSSIPPLERIRGKCDQTYETQREIQQRTGKVLGCRLCCLGAEMCTQDDTIRDKVRELLARQRRYWETAIRDAQAEGLVPPGSATERARCAMAYFEGLVAQARLHNDSEMLRDLGRLVLEHVQKSGAAAPAAA